MLSALKRVPPEIASTIHLAQGQENVAPKVIKQLIYQIDILAVTAIIFSLHKFS